MDLLFVNGSVTNDEIMAVAEHKLRHATALWWIASKTGSATEENKIEFIY